MFNFDMNQYPPSLIFKVSAIFFLSFFLAILKGIILTPYDTLLHGESVQLRNYGGEGYDLHPFFSHDFFTLYGLKIFPFNWFFSPALHVISAVLMIFSVSAIVVHLLMRADWDFWIALFGSGFIISFGHSILSSVFDLISLPPGLTIFYGYYNPRTFVVPLVLGSMLALTHKRMFLGGLLIGLATLLHIKFGLRSFGLILFCLMVWNFFGVKYSGVRLHFSIREILVFLLVWVFCFTIVFFDIKEVEGFLRNLNQPRDAYPFLSPLSFAIKTEPDDYFFSFHFFNQPWKIFGLIFSIIFSFVTLEFFRRKSSGPEQAMLLVCLIALCFAVLNSLAGLTFEQLLIDHIPEKFQRFIVLSRFWDSLWVVTSLFSLAVFMVGNFLVLSIFKNKQKARAIFFSLAFFVFWSAQIAKSLKHNEKWQWYYVAPTKAIKYLYSDSFVQVCNKDVDNYNAEWEKTLEFAKKNDVENFKKQQNKIKKFFLKIQKQGNESFDSGPYVANLEILFDLKNGNFSKAIRSLFSFPKIDKPVLWSCQKVPGPGIFNLDIKIPKADYFDVLNWLKKNSLKEQGIIQPPYIIMFYMKSDRIGFWGPKVDKHPMYMLPDYWPLGQARMERTAGRFAIEKTLGIGGIGAHGRMHYLTLDKKAILSIKLSYPQYEFILTEDQKLDFPKLYANNSFAIYSIVEN
jgi:hypothetical protein